LPSVKGVDKASAQGHATIKTDVKTFIEINVLTGYQNTAAIPAINETTIVKYLLVVFEKFVNWLSDFLLNVSLFQSYVR